MAGSRVQPRSWLIFDVRQRNMNGYDNESDVLLGSLLEYFGDRLNRIFAYYFCVLEFEADSAMQGDPITSSRAWALQAIKNACYHETFDGHWARVAAEEIRSHFSAG